MEGYILKYRVTPIWRTTFAKPYGISEVLLGTHWWTPWELGKHVGNLMGTHWELKGDTLGTREKWKKSSQKSLSPFLAWPNTRCKEHLTYIGEKGRTLGKTYGIEVRCYWEHPWGTHREHREPIGNLNRTCWKQRKNEKKIKALWMHAETSHWLHEISISKTVGHHSWPGLIPPL
jgi:hypothetical protein